VTVFSSNYSDKKFDEAVSDDFLLNGTIRILFGTNLTISKMSFIFNSCQSDHQRNLFEYDFGSTGCLVLSDIKISQVESFFFFFLLLLLLFIF
jgi:hypothetical protein